MEVLDNLRRVLKAHKDALGSEVALVKAIEQASGSIGKLERRKLRAILGSDGKRLDVTLRLSELQVLHAYLLAGGHGGFGSVLTGPTLLRSVADRRKVAFIIPSKQLRGQGTTAIIHWDLRAMIEALRALERIDPTINIVIEDVLLREPADAVLEGSVSDDSWLDLLTGEDSPSLICIGSPRANHAAELLLAKMYGVLPFSPTSRSTLLPFRFFWQAESRPSSFTVTEDELKPHRDKLKKFLSGGRCSALLVRCEDMVEQCLVVDRDKKSRQWKTYGIIAAQRREHGQLWVVAAGLEGPASLGAAKELASLESVPAVDGTGVSKVMQYYVTYEVHSRDAPAGVKQDTRELGRLVQKRRCFFNGV